MNKIFKQLIGTALVVAFGAVLFASCSDDDDNGVVGFIVDKDVLDVAAEGGSLALAVESSQEWVAVASEPWLMVSPANGIGSTECIVSVDSSLVNGLRTATIRFAPENDAAVIVTVNQSGFGKAIKIAVPDAEIAASAQYEERYYEAEVTTNTPFKLEIEYDDDTQEWLSHDDVEINLDRGARPRNVKVRFDWKMNTEPRERTARINFIPTDGEPLEEPAVLVITQKAALKIEDNRRGDSLALLTIFERLNTMSDGWDTSENMINWDNITLWEANDTDLPCPEAAGRVRSATFFMFNTKETIPQEIKYLKYLETLYVGSNVNTMLKSIDLGSEVCTLDYLKNLTIFSYGLVTLPDDFKNLGNSLEYLDLSANNFASVPDVLTKENFPKLTTLRLVSNRRWTTMDLRRRNEYENGIGMYINTANDNSLRRLFLWDTLEELSLSNNYIEGELPDFTVGENGVEAYTQADVDAFGGDTIQYLADKSIPKILPRMKHLAINLNFFTGNLPDWILYHPNLLMWYPESLIFNQQETGRDSEGNAVRFDNEPKNFEYYYSVFPGMREKYEFNEERE